MEKGERDREKHRASHKEKLSPKPLTERTKGADYHYVIQCADVKDWSFRGPCCGWCRPWRTLQCSGGKERRADNPGADGDF